MNEFEQAAEYFRVNGYDVVVEDNALYLVLDFAEDTDVMVSRGEVEYRADLYRNSYMKTEVEDE